MKILVVDDHVLIREALRGVLKDLQPDAAIREAPDSRQAMLRIAETPDLELIVLDLTLPDRSGFEMLAEVRERHPAIPVVVLSASRDRDDIARVLDLGALGFIPKSASREVMLSAFKLIFAGGIYVPPEILGRPQPAPAPQPAPPSLSPSPPSPRLAAELRLTERQLEVLKLMMRARATRRSVGRSTLPSRR